jgi:hypothetical protein
MINTPLMSMRVNFQSEKMFSGCVQSVLCCLSDELFVDSVSKAIHYRGNARCMFYAGRCARCLYDPNVPPPPPNRCWNNKQTNTRYVLAIGYNGKVTHHLIKRRPDDGLFVVNKNENFGTYQTVEQMVETLSSFEYLPEGWPVRLSEGVDRSTGAFFDLSGDVYAQRKVPNEAIASGECV